ncbi:serine/threonine-protein kinase ATR-like, partial [Limulus polyphemus]|uniref:Serine/threonine-protein kinase ATR-like n=1 Tax=Limulus polyphemus TaxID=6850 RepID=A0ABM1T3J6_LIMPO
MEEKNTEQLSELSDFKIDSSKGEDSTDVQVVKYRKMLNKLILTIFTDIKKVAEDLEKQAPVSPTLLTCVNNCREEFPHIFVMERLRKKDQEHMETDVGDISNLTVTTLSSDNQGVLALGFTQWLLSQLIRLLTFPELRELHNSCVQLLASILGTVRLGDLVSFSHLCQSFIQLIVDLETFKENCYRSGYNTNSLFTTQSFKISEEALKVNNTIKAEEKLNFSVIPIVLKSVEGCECFQVQVMLVMELLVFDLLQFTPGSKEKLWNVLCTQLELGGINLKVATLRVMQSVLSAAGLPDAQTLFCQFFSCLFGLVKFCCSEEQPKHSNKEELETHLSSVLEKTVCVLDYTPLIYSVDGTILYHTAIDLVEILDSYGLYHLTSGKLRVTIVDTLTYLMGYLERRNFSIPKKLIESLSEVLLNHCGKIVDSQCVKTTLLYIQRKELQQLSVKNLMTQEKPVQHQASTSRLSSKRKRVIDDIKGGEPLKFQEDTCRNPSWKSPGMNAIHKKICELTEKACQKMKTENLADVKFLNGLTTCVDILSSLSSVESQRDKRSATRISPFATPVHHLSKWSATRISPFATPVHHLSKWSATRISPFATPVHHLSKWSATRISPFATPVHHLNNEDLNVEIQQKACFILSLPWLLETSTDIQNFNVGKVTNEQKSQWAVAVTQIVTTECLQALMRLPGQMFPEWRLHVLRHVMHKRKEENVEVLLYNLPLFCHLVKQDSDQISSEIIRLAIEMDNIKLHVAVAEILGKLCCILSGETVLIRSLGTSCQGAVIFQKKQPTCSRCQPEKIDGFLFSDQTSDKPIWISEILPNLLKHENSVVKIATFSSLPSVFAHVPITEQLLSSCLELMKDPVFEVRLGFSKIVQHMIKPFGKPYPEGWTVQYDELLVSKLKSVFCVAQKNRNIHLQKTVLLTIGQIGKVATDNLLLISIVCLLESLFSKILLITTTAKLQMKKLAEVKGVKMVDLFKQFKLPICKFLMEAMLECCSQGSVEVLFILNEFVSIFGYQNTRTFLSSTLRYILPPLATKASPEASMLLKVLAKQMRMQRRELLMNHFKYIFSYLVRHCSKEEMEKALTYVQTETDIEIGSLLRCDYQRIHNELLLHISTHYEQVFSGLAMLAWKEETYDGPKPITKPEDMARFLQPRLLGFLAFFDSQLLNANFPLEEKKLALGSLNSIMELMGPKHITTVRMKVMATLKIAIRFTEEDFPQICAQAWNTFVHNVELQSLGSLLNQVMTALLPLLQFHPQGVAAIFHFLVVENRKKLNKYFHDLYFIPELAELTEVNSVLKEYIDRPSRQADFHSLLSHSLKGVSHENLEVCFHALRKVKQLLSSHQ